MNESPLNTRARQTLNATVRWSPELHGSRAVRPANRTELRWALEANEVFFSLMERLPDGQCCGIGE